MDGEDDDPLAAHRAALTACRGTLPEPAAEALRLRYEGGKPFAEVADALGRTVAGARQLVQRTRSLLRDCVERRLNP